jgi:hypothetical protein
MAWGDKKVERKVRTNWNGSETHIRHTYTEGLFGEKYTESYVEDKTRAGARKKAYKKR